MSAPDRSPKASAPTSSSLPDTTTREGVDGRRIKKVFLWTFVGWAVFWTLGWSTHHFKAAMEWIAFLLLALVAALISTLAYWGVKKIMKPDAETVRRANAAELENAELRRKVDELSRKSED